MTAYTETIARMQREHGARFVEPKTTREQRFYFRGSRVEVTTEYASGEKHVRRGTIGITTGWSPALLLMSRKGLSGSSDVLSECDRITAVIGKRGERLPVHI